MKVFTRILTDFEKKQARTYLKQNGKKTVNVQVLVSRARKHLPTIQSDLELLERLLRRYEATKKR